MLETPPPRRTDRDTLRDGALVAGLAAVIHGRTVAFGWTGLDDADLLAGDLSWLRERGSLAASFTRAYMGAIDPAHPYYRPLVTLSYAADAQVWGGRPWGFHLTNVLLFAAASAALLVLLRALGLGRGAALVAALVFAVHPTVSGAVAWVPGRNDVLLALLAIAAWWALARGRTSLHLAAFALAMLTKETAAVLPLVWALDRASRPVSSTGKGGWAALAGGWGAVLLARWALWPSHPSVSLGGVPLVVAGLGRLALPVHPSLLSDAQDLGLVPGLAALAGIACATRVARGPRRRAIAIGVAAFLLALLPPLLAGGTLWLDDRLVLPAVGLAIAGGATMSEPLLARREARAAIGAAIGGLALLTVVFEGTYRNEPTFAREAVEDAPHSALARVCLGRAAQARGDDDRAFEAYEAALALGPAEVAHNNLGVLYMKRGRWADAERELRAELAINPSSQTARDNLASVLRRSAGGAR